MSDNKRELLELAAKAAGIELRFLSGTIPFSDGPERVGEWNPLTDDGDALRLAVRLALVVQNRSKVGQAYASTLDGTIGALETYGKGDPNAATRRAIVRAAAEIGKAMP